MANADTPYGLRPVMHINGSPWNGAVNAYYATDSTALFIGDPVVMTGESKVVEVEGNPPGSVPIVKVAAAGQANAISGVVVGFQPIQATSAPYKAAAREDRLIYVCDDPDVLFKIQADATSANTAVGTAHQLISTHTGSTVTGRSGFEMDSTIATGGTGAQLVVHRALPEPGNDITTANSKWLVRINRHTSRISAAAVGDL